MEQVEGRGQISEVGGQTSEDSRQPAAGRGQKSEDSRLRLMASARQGGQKAAGSIKTEVGGRKSEIRRRRAEDRDQRSEVRDQKATRN